MQRTYLASIFLGAFLATGIIHSILTVNRMLVSVFDIVDFGNLTLVTPQMLSAICAKVMSGRPSTRAARGSLMVTVTLRLRTPPL